MQLSWWNHAAVMLLYVVLPPCVRAAQQQVEWRDVRMFCVYGTSAQHTLWCTTGPGQFIFLQVLIFPIFINIILMINKIKS